MPTHDSKITFNGKELIFRQDNGSLLRSVELQGETPAYQCREGFCGACRAVLKSGQVSYTHEPLAFVREGEILLCCSVPQGDIVIDTD
ncbi:class I ribonucleotide reductase maintenance protein YfaE [Pseudoalteromonas sp. SSDWG2]|uniref:class I ribonucleotide reductase maintenance protein YfaE n=1 Tax=Pseudoalteromonas sp. SSDWG2 TaxID=3139391 RepID=UPI003BA84FA1